jgi:hypothetical protein
MPVLSYIEVSLPGIQDAYGIFPMTQSAPEVERRGGLGHESNPVVSAADLIRGHLCDPQTSWAIGTFGAIAEFHRGADEPEGVVPSVEIFPANAIHDEHGKRATFDAGRHEAFQSLLAVHGDPACSNAKLDTFAAVRAGEPPRDVSSYSRAQRLARRVALRQVAQTDGLSPALTAWREMFDCES